MNQTRNMRIAEVHMQGQWKFYNFFQAGGAWYSENGHMKPNTEAGGFCNGTLSGSPLFSCGLCGHSPIVDHYTIQNLQNDELLNVGNECINQMIGVDKAEKIVAGIESLKRKVAGDFKRKIYHEQLVQWLTENLNALSKGRNKQIDNWLSTEPERYWLSKTEMVQKYENGKFVFDYDDKGREVRVMIEKVIPENIRKHDAQKKEKYDRDFWQRTLERFTNADWNPMEFRKNYSEIVMDNAGLEIPKIRKLTEKENNEIQEQRRVLLDEFMARYKNMESKK